MEKIKQFNFDVLGIIKYFMKLLKQVRRKKIIMYSSWLSLMTGIIYFFVDKNFAILLIFIFATTTMGYNVTCWLDQQYEIAIKKRKNK